MRRFAVIVVLLACSTSYVLSASAKDSTSYRDLSEAARKRAAYTCGMGWLIELWAACALEEDRQTLSKLINGGCVVLDLTLDPQIDSIITSGRAYAVRPQYLVEIAGQVSTLEAECLLLGSACGQAQLWAQIQRDGQLVNDESRDMLVKILGNGVELSVRIKLPDELLYDLTNIQIKAGEAKTTTDFGKLVDDVMLWRVKTCRELADYKQ